MTGVIYMNAIFEIVLDSKINTRTVGASCTSISVLASRESCSRRSAEAITSTTLTATSRSTTSWWLHRNALMLSRSTSNSLRSRIPVRSQICPGCATSASSCLAICQRGVTSPAMNSRLLSLHWVYIQLKLSSRDHLRRKKCSTVTQLQKLNRIYTCTCIHVIVIGTCTCLVFTVAAVYAYLEATDYEPGDFANLVSPLLPFPEEERCLSFQFSAYGNHIGQLNVLDQNGDVIWSFESNSSISMLPMILLCNFPP